MGMKTSVTMGLRDVLTKEWFERVAAEFQSRYGLTLESVDTQGRMVGCLSSRPCYPYFCSLIRESRPGLARCYKSRVRWMNLACQSGRPHIGVCHAGITLGCVPVVYRGRRLGGMFFGMCLTHKPGKLVVQELFRRFKGFRYPWLELGRATRRLKTARPQDLVRAGGFLESQLKQALVPEKVGVLRKEKTLRLAGMERKQNRLRSELPGIDTSSRLWQAAEFMKYHCDRPIKLQECAYLSGLSVFRFAHVFREETGFTPMEYLTRMRIEHAKRMLEKSDMKHWEIKQAIGYTHQSYFIRVFKRVVGMTPQQYRLNHKRR